MKRDSIKIQRGKALQLNIIGSSIEDERLFTNSRKLVVYLNTMKRIYSPFKVTMKLRSLN
jgi:hypothetical protein